MKVYVVMGEADQSDCANFDGEEATPYYFIHKIYQSVTEAHNEARRMNEQEKEDANAYDTDLTYYNVYSYDVL